ncbi:MAG TPA: response regulator [Chloroflexota bacterium]|nr:response regulator [Chloroflexota bacterium]
MANMSHELRTPLNSMLILSEILSENGENNLNPKQVEFARTILGAGSDLLMLINDILDLSKIESGMLTLDVVEVSFEDLADNTRHTFEPLVRAKRLTFAVELGPGLPRSMRTDALRLQQVLRNLLSNAFKFTERGSVGLAVSVAAGGWSPDSDTLNLASTVISFAVSDTGLGVSADKLAVIFEAFQQADMTTGRRFGGTGLGLSISRGIATLLGGEIAIASEPRQGSCFTLYLPVELHRPDKDRTSAPPVAPWETEPPPHRPCVGDLIPPEQIHSSSPVIAGKKVLIVDDDIRNIFALTSALENHQLEISSVESGSAAIAVLRTSCDVDAVLMDVMMPDMDGFEVIRTLRADPRFADLPIIAVTAKAMTTDRDQCLDAGASDYISKPIDINQLVSLLGVWLTR